MTNETMSLERFASILDAYGAAPSRWPDGERAAALALAARSPQARERLERARALDRLLDAARPPEPSVTLRAAILRTAPRPAGPSVRALAAAGRGGWRGAAAALAASGLLGLAAGGVIARDAGPEPSVDLLALALFDDDPAGY